MVGGGRFFGDLGGGDVCTGDGFQRSYADLTPELVPPGERGSAVIIINRPSVAGAVLQTPQLIIDLFTDGLSKYL